MSKAYAITADGVTYLVEAGREQVEGAFATAEEFATLVADWPLQRLVEVWNKLAGVRRYPASRTAPSRCSGSGAPCIRSSSHRECSGPHASARVAEPKHKSCCACCGNRKVPASKP